MRGRGKEKNIIGRKRVSKMGGKEGEGEGRVNGGITSGRRKGKNREQIIKNKRKV